MVPEIGLGTWKFDAGIEPLRRGVELGACLVDTAEAYGNEELVGRAVAEFRDDVFIATKVAPNHLRHDDVIEAANRSLERLRVDAIDLYQIHWPNAVVPIAETMGAMEELVDGGKVRFIGVCNFSLGRLREAERALGKHRIASNQVSYSLVDRTIELDLIPYCEERGITVIAYSPLAHGPEKMARKDRHGALAKLAAETGKTEAQIALNWCVSRPNVIAIPKAASLDHVAENCDASDWRLSPGQIAMLEKSFRRRGYLEVGARRLARKALRRLRR